MQITDRRMLGPGFERKLRAALDSATPPTPHFFNARYRSVGWVGSTRPWRIASALAGVGAVVLMALSAAAATSSPNPAVWTQRAVSTIQSVSHIPDNNPIPPPQNSAPEPRGTAPISHDGGTTNPVSQPSGHSAQASDKPQQSQKGEASPRPDESPKPDHSRQPWPSPTPSDPHGQEGAPIPPPNDQNGEHSKH
jgi:hypothetical protein